MPLIDDLRRIAATRGQQAALAEANARADRGDAEALLMRGEWRLWGMNGVQDLSAAHTDIARAAETGDATAMLTQAALLFTGTGTPRDFDAGRALVEHAASRSPLARQHVDLARQLDGPIPPAEPLSEAPYIARVEGFLAPDLCAFVMARAAPQLQPSMVVDPATGRQSPNPVRTSDGTNFAPSDEDLVIHGINMRLAALSGTDVLQGEPLHVLRYRPGQQYRPHLDGLTGVLNQRILTVLVYLNDGYAGGATAFPKLGISVEARAGDALIFANTDAQGRADPLTEHAGTPVVSGEKWVATRWIRANPCNAFLPATMA